jgi:hypothetical protein
VFIAKALEDAKAEVRAPTTRRPRRSRNGVRRRSRKEEFRRAAQFLGLTKADIADIQREFGAGKTLDLFAKIGGSMGEDFFASGIPAQRGSASPASRRHKRSSTRLINDEGFREDPRRR